MTSNKRLTIIFSVIAGILALQLIAMQFSDEVNWSVSDFVIAGVLLSGTGLLIELVISKVRGTGYRLAICAVVLLALLIVWAELAVGIFGTPFAGS